MCGITGFIDNHTLNLDYSESLLKRMISTLSHRGPDDSGYWINDQKKIFLGHSRLSIIDLGKTGKQPMISFDNRYTMVYNGEIYNFLKIKKKIEKEFSYYNWKGTSDSEVLLTAIVFFGLKKTLEEINGMFAIALWDNKKKKLYLVRDRFGEKPLYYGEQGSGIKKNFIFSSELKAFKIHPYFENKLDENSINLQICLNNIPAPYSIYKNIYKVEPGEIIEINSIDGFTKIYKKEKYWDSAISASRSLSNQFQGSLEDSVNIVKDLLIDSVKTRMLSDVDLGSFLSGGIDSSVIVALMQNNSTNKVKTFSIGFEDNNFDEAQRAKKISYHLGTEHNELYVNSLMALNVVEKLSDVYDEPFSDSSQIPTIIISEYAKKKIKVALSGDGGDELFCGYNRYKFIYLLWEVLQKFNFKTKDWFCKKIKNLLSKEKGYLINSKKRELIYKFLNALNKDNLSNLYQNLLFNNNEHILNNKNLFTKKITKTLQILNSFSNVEQIMIADTIFYLSNDILTKVDRASMYHSLETRMPYLDKDLYNFCWSLPAKYKINLFDNKIILKQIFLQYFPKKFLGKKSGFSIPLSSWLKGPLKSWSLDLVSQKNDYLNKDFINKEFKSFYNDKNNSNNQALMWNILIFLQWYNSNAK